MWSIHNEEVLEKEARKPDWKVPISEKLSEGLVHRRTDSQPAPPRSKAKAGELSVCLRRRKAFRKPPRSWRLSEGLGHRRTDRQPAPPRSKAKAGELSVCLRRRKAFRKPPPRWRLSEGLGHQRTDSQLVHQITKILDANPEDVRVKSPLSKLRSSERWDLPLQGWERSRRNNVLSLDRKSKKGVRGRPVTSKTSSE
ncbi:hypothetical protein QTO34_014362, partial [Cnephaeus nilssonii]